MTKMLYQVHDDESYALLMIAPLGTIRQAFNLHLEAVERIKQETAKGLTSGIHFNGRSTPIVTSGSIKIIAFGTEEDL